MPGGYDDDTIHKEEIKMEENKETFRYSYSATQQTEVNEIREKYLPKEETKMDQLRKLDASAAKPGVIVSVIIGIVGVLLFGLGMTWVTGGSKDLIVLGINISLNNQFVLGIVIGVIGLAMIALASPVYNYITKKRREKLAPQILKLADELSGPEQ